MFLIRVKLNTNRKHRVHIKYENQQQIVYSARRESQNNYECNVRTVDFGAGDKF